MNVSDSDLLDSEMAQSVVLDGVTVPPGDILQRLKYYNWGKGCLTPGMLVNTLQFTGHPNKHLTPNVTSGEMENS